MQDGYYSEKLNADRLFQVYQSDIPQVRTYLRAETDFVRSRLRGDERVLELGAGYGRIMKELAPYAASITGIDLSERTVELGREYLRECPNCSLLVMNAHSPVFSGTFDGVLCLQNGLSAMKGDPENLVRQAVVAAPRGLFHTYSPNSGITVCIAQEQPEGNALGDRHEKTVNGIIVCRATGDFRPAELRGWEISERPSLWRRRTVRHIIPDCHKGREFQIYGQGANLPPSSLPLSYFIASAFTTCGRLRRDADIMVGGYPVLTEIRIAARSFQSFPMPSRSPRFGLPQ